MVFLSHWGLNEYNIMPLGLANPLETSQMLMNSVFHEFLDRFFGVYLDDLLVYSKSLEDYVFYLNLGLD